MAEGAEEADAALLGHQIWAALHGAVMLEIAGLLPEGFDAASLHTRTAGTLFEARPKRGQGSPPVAGEACSPRRCSAHTIT